MYRFQALLQRLQKNIDAKHQLVSPSHREIALSLQREINEVDPIRIITGPIVGKVRKRGLCRHIITTFLYTDMWCFSNVGDKDKCGNCIRSEYNCIG